MKIQSVRDKLSTIIFLLCIGMSFSLYGQQKAFVTIPAGHYAVGAENHPVNPLRTVFISSFSISTTEVTNREFSRFIQETNYITGAEKYRDALVFEPGLEEFRWITDSTANWRFPNGKGRGGIEEKMDHPVTCISFMDAVAYCKWAGVRLPSLEEWETAAKAGSKSIYFDSVTTDNIVAYANIWHGKDHLKADSSDGYMYTAPVASFKPNPLGLYDVFGNVFEFCTGSLARDGDRAVAHARGGSWWCSKHACSFFNAVDIGCVNPHASFSNQGFRVVKKQPPKCATSH